MDYTSGYYSVHTFLMNATGRRTTGKDTFAVHGIDLIAYQGRNQVFRAANSGRAADYVRQQGSESKDRAAQVFRTEDAVPGLSGSTCLSTIVNLYGQANRVFACYASRGRRAGSLAPAGAAGCGCQLHGAQERGVTGHPAPTSSAATTYRLVDR